MKQLLLMIVAVVMVGCGLNEDNTEVKINDPILNDILAQLLGKPHGELAPEAIFTKSELSTVFELGDTDGRDELFTDATIREFFKLPNLHDLGLGDQITDEALRDVAKMKNVRSLVLGKQITDEGLETISNMKHIVWLSLSSSQITDKGLKTISERDNLRSLSFRRQKITKEGFKEIFKMHNLTNLELGYLPVDDSMLSDIVKMRGLKEGRLAISNTKITSQGASKLRAAMPNCEIIRRP
ncbi:hypothetical protein OAK45_00410 [Verrucomicrobia bacterium]|nr:hypothetical protein [Verrucomicrobiota bacterium]